MPKMIFNLVNACPGPRPRRLRTRDGTKTGWTDTIQSESTANWKANTDKWTVPINGIVSKMSTFGPFPASYFVGFGVYPVHSDIGPTWKLRSGVSLVLPTKK